MLLGTGLFGALTTYSTFPMRRCAWPRAEARFSAAVNLTASVAAGLGAALVDAAFAQAVWA
ncbi:hypothetical protein [Streptomyces sp. NPDC004533]|uniref:hypothetical protein n=1 Tax=Streptomyces sp. NPDC004533 TaxID=3154278 RepID=UPI0033BAF6D6